MKNDPFLLSLKETWKAWPKLVGLYAIIWLAGALIFTWLAIMTDP